MRETTSAANLLKTAGIVPLLQAAVAAHQATELRRRQPLLWRKYPALMRYSPAITVTLITCTLAFTVLGADADTYGHSPAALTTAWPYATAALMCLLGLLFYCSQYARGLALRWETLTVFAYEKRHGHMPLVAQRLVEAVRRVTAAGEFRVKTLEDDPVLGFGFFKDDGTPTDYADILVWDDQGKVVVL